MSDPTSLQYPPVSGVAPTLVCRFCGSVPAANVTFRGHRGMIVLASFLKQTGPMCRDCGLATFRKMTASTLLLGWWGWISVFATPVTVLINAVRRSNVANLATPQRVPGVVVPLAAPMSPGKPLLARPQAIIGLVIVAGIVVWLGVAVAGAATAS